MHMSQNHDHSDSDGQKHPHGRVSTLADQVREATGQSVAECYQCGKCSGGCPLAAESDLTPNQVLRMLQLRRQDLDERVLGSMAIWLCLTCQTCLSRCPKEVDLPKVMDFLRAESMRRGMVNPNARDIVDFHESFVSAINACGRVFEMGLITSYKMKSKHFLQDMLVAPKMFKRGKLHLLPHMIEGRKAVQDIIKRSQQKKESQK
jgi:heterodisulfide reductase subunit C2